MLITYGKVSFCIYNMSEKDNPEDIFIFAVKPICGLLIGIASMRQFQWVPTNMFC